MPENLWDYTLNFFFIQFLIIIIKNKFFIIIYDCPFVALVTKINLTIPSNSKPNVKKLYFKKYYKKVCSQVYSSHINDFP